MPFFTRRKQTANISNDQAPIRLDTRRLYLRGYQASDWQEWADLRQKSADILKPWEPTWPKNALSYQSFEKRMAFYRLQQSNGRGYYFLYFNQDNVQLIGGVSLSRIARGAEQHVTLGYWCGKPYLRQGYAFEAVQAAIDFAFNTLEINRIQASSMPDNKPSAGLLEKAGFTHEGLAREYLKIQDIWEDHNIYALTKSQWRTHKGIHTDSMV